jgi:hypothetical protein
MATMQSVIDKARLDLNDDDKVRHPDVTLLVFGNDFIQEAGKTRPDLFFPNPPPDSSLALGATFPLSDRYTRACADYIIARSKLRGTEESKMVEASGYLQMAASSTGVS